VGRIKIKQKVLGKTNRLLPFDTTWSAPKITQPKILRCRGNAFIELLLLNNKEDTQTEPQAQISNSSSTLPTFFDAETCLRNRYLAMIGGIHFTESLPCNDRRDTHTDTQNDGRGL
jgi:hypothetical protein